MKFTTKFVAVLTALGLATVINFVAATLAVAQSSEVWVDDDYCISCSNDAHSWGYDAFDKVQDGIDAVASPGTVYVAAGIYEGKVVLKTQMALLGTGIGVSIIDGMGLKEGVEDTVVAMASGSKISGFSIINGGWNGAECRGVSAIIEGNLVAHHEAVGIHLIGAGSGNSIVSNNIVTDCASYMPKLRFVGAIFGNSVYGSPQIINNTVVDNHYTGIGFCHPGTPIIKNNIVVGNIEGIGVCDNVAPINSHNNSWNNGGYNWFGLLQGEGAISSDPLFVDELEGNYHLKADSPCIDRGTDAGVYIDIGGDMRPFGMGFDMGADEFTPTIWIQAEDYKKGGQNVAYYDKTLGNAGGQYRNDDVDIWWYGPDTFYTGANATGEWMDYTIDVPSEGNCRLDIRFATPNSNRRVHVEFDGVDKTGSLVLPNTGGWTTWQTLSTNVTLSAGHQVMRLMIDYGGLNIDHISLVYMGDDAKVATPSVEPNGYTFIDSVQVTLATSTADATIYYTIDGSDPYTSATSTEYISPFTLTEDNTIRAYAMKVGMADSDEAIADFYKEFVEVPVMIIQAEDYDQGGQHVSYYDTTAGNKGGQYRNDDVDIWLYGRNTYYTGANASGEWLNYTIDVPFNGNYRLDIQLATPKDNRIVKIYFDDSYKYYYGDKDNLIVPNTGGWTNWQTLSKSVILEAGRKDMRVYVSEGGLNIDQFSLVYSKNDKVWYGDYLIESENDLIRLSGYTSVTGDLNIDGEMRTWPGFYCLPYLLPNLKSLSNLSHVGGDLTIRCIDFTECTEHGLDNLNRIDGSLIIRSSLPLQFAEELRDQVLSRGGIGGDIIIEP